MSAAKNHVRIERLHGTEAAKDNELVQNLEVLGWTGTDVKRKIEVLKSNGAEAVTVKLSRTGIEFLRTEVSADTDLEALSLDLAKKGATRKEIKEIAKAAMELNSVVFE